MKKRKPIQQISPVIQDPRALWNKRQVARFLDVAVSTVDQWVSGKRSGIGPRFLKVGSLVRFDPEDVHAYVEQRKKVSQPATRQEAQA